jgi:uncharacterized repeat protein (TIGR03803 family)
MNPGSIVKPRCGKMYLLPALIASLGLLLADRVTAQNFMTLYSFTEASGYPPVNSDGANPIAGLILSGNTLYGTAFLGGSSGWGTVFSLNTNGTSFTNLHSLTSGSEGAKPYAGLILSGNTLYGTTVDGGNSNAGTVFAVNTDGSGFTNLHSFTANPGPLYTNSDGAHPVAGLVLSGNALYGTSQSGGSLRYGTLFTVNTDGTGFTNLHTFTRNSDGASPQAGLILSGNTLYGTTASGGSSDNGTVFAINTDGTGFTNLHGFAGYPSAGAGSYAVLILSGNTLYGTTMFGGSSDNGTVFAVNTDGAGFTTLHNFTAASGGFPPVNSDGVNPRAGLILSDNTLYGTAHGGGSSGHGTVFAVNTDGTGFTTLYSFTALNNSTNSDGANPIAGLILSGNTLYGTARDGGSSGWGTVFSLSLPPPQLTIIPSGANVILTWPTNAAGFTLQSAPAFSSTFTNILGATSPYTNEITGPQKYFRLISN